MDIKFGYCTFCDKEDNVALSFLKEGGGKDVLGLRKMNIRISDLLFPECSTLMPNLVYFYYLYAIYDVIENWNQENTKETQENVDRYERIISQAVVYSKGYKPKGFFGKDSERRAYSVYRAKLNLLGFIGEPKNEAFKELTNEWNITLRESPRYKMVKECMECIRREAIQEASEKDKTFLYGKYEETKNTENFSEEKIFQLTDEERLDFCKRVVLREGKSKGSLFAWLVLVHINNSLKYQELWRTREQLQEEKFKVNGGGECALSTIFGLEMPEDKKKENFDRIRNYDKIGTDNTSKENYQYKKYQNILFYSNLQYVAKMAYNYMLFRNDKDDTRKEEYKNKLERAIKELEKYNKKNKTSIEKILDSSDADIVGAIDFLLDIKKKCKEENAVEELTAYHENNLIAAREREIMGSGSFLEYPILGQPIADYVDTFRWEYRPEEDETEVEKASEEGKASVEGKTAEENNKVTREETLPTKCASYYIYELFYENKAK